MSRFWQDARLALRGFRRSPTFAVTAVLILGVGIGLATAMWTVFNAVLLEVSPTDPLALIGACALLLAVAAIAAYVPAYHASRVDPARALQAD